MHGAGLHIMGTKPSGATDDDLELIGLMVMRADDGIGVLLDQEGHGINRVRPWWRFRVRLVTIATNIRG